LRIVWAFARTTSSMSGPRSGGSGASPWRAKTAILEGVQTALSGPASVAMGLPGALEELTNLCRESAE
jgi:hypothetical protein